VTGFPSGPCRQCDPLPRSLEARHTAGRKNARDFLQGHLAEVVDNHKVHEIVGIRQVPAVEYDRGYFAVQPAPADVLACPGYAAGVPVEALHKVSVVRPQCRRQPSVAAANMHDQPASDTGGFKNLPGQRLFDVLLRHVGAIQNCGGYQRYHHREDPYPDSGFGVL